MVTIVPAIHSAPNNELEPTLVGGLTPAQPEPAVVAPTPVGNCATNVETTMPDIPPLFNPGLFGSLNTEAGWRRVDRGADEGYEYQHCGVLPEGIRAATVNQVDDETSKVNVPDGTERGGTPPRAVGERSGDSITVREDGLIRVETTRERGDGGRDAPGGGSNGGGSPNASLNIQDLLNEQPLRSPRITGGVEVAEASAPTIGSNAGPRQIG